MNAPANSGIATDTSIMYRPHPTHDNNQTTGTCIYSDVIPRAGKRFLDRSQLLPAMGLLPTLGGNSKPVLNLEFLLDDVVRNTVPLDWCVKPAAFFFVGEGHCWGGVAAFAV